jgi:hypothetical protein
VAGQYKHVPIYTKYMQQFATITINMAKLHSTHHISRYYLPQLAVRRLFLWHRGGLLGTVWSCWCQHSQETRAAVCVSVIKALWITLVMLNIIFVKHWQPRPWPFNYITRIGKHLEWVTSAHSICSLVAEVIIAFSTTHSICFLVRRIIFVPL